MKKGKNYGYHSIEVFANENQFTIKELGNLVVGEHFLKLTHEEKDIVISFVLMGGANNQYVYECVYSDFGEFEDENEVLARGYF